MPVYQDKSGDSDHELYPSDESPEHVHYNDRGQVCIVTLREGGQDTDEQYDGEPYQCNFCDEEADYVDDHECDGCGDTFETKAGLSSHMNHCDEITGSSDGDDGHDGESGEDYGDN